MMQSLLKEANTTLKSETWDSSFLIAVKVKYWKLTYFAIREFLTLEYS
jgi:hypothetical protein